MNNKKLADIADYLHELVRFRNNERVQKEEFNSFTEVEASYYQARTDAIYKLACEYDEKHDEHCEIKLMTLDEAIEHATDVANNELCTSCAAEHKQLANWLSELKDIKNRYAYLAADFDNYKKRVVRNEQIVHDKAYESVILKFLDIYDDMEKLYNEIKSCRNCNADDNIEIDVDIIESGYSMIFKNLEKLLISLNCEKIPVKQGDKFDVNLMDAISSRKIAENEKYEENDVVEIFRTGWKLNGKVIKPTKVVVAASIN